MTNQETEDTESKNHNGIVATKGPSSERLLAHTLGYPLGWHVVRTITDSGDYSDCIYTGNHNKKTGLDMYFNHFAAYTAALKWKEGESTGFENEGGQLLPRVSSFKVGDIIEVLYEPDNCWYDATILKVKEYEDDIRYTVHYTEEDSTQANVHEDLIRFPDPKSKKKKKKKPTEKKSKEKKKKETPSKKSKAKGITTKGKTKASIDNTNQKTMDAFLTSTKNKGNKKRKAPSPKIDHAKEIGLPDGWTASLQINSQRYTIRSPDGKLFRSKKKALEHASIMKNKSSTKKSVTTPATGKITEIQEEGDPPWRKVDHDYLGKKVIYKTGLPHDENIEISQIGTVCGWIDEGDVDKDGNPGFISERTGIPAPLFHVIFDYVTHTESDQQYHSCLLESQDLEEYELLDCLVDEKEVKAFHKKAKGGFIIDHVNGEKNENQADVDEDDEDEVPLSSLLKQKKSKML